MALKTIPMSKNATCQYIDDTAENMQDQLIEQVKKSHYFALQHEADTDWPTWLSVCVMWQ